MSRLLNHDSMHYVEEDDTVSPRKHLKNGQPQVITGDMARQGPLGKPVLWVLLGGMALVIVALVAVWMFSGAPHLH
jgi:hypothetical protein